MQLSKSIKRAIYWELGIPLALLSIGIYHGLMQVIYRAGVLRDSSFAQLDYYQGLTLHGVINAIVLTTFFAVAFGHATIAFYLKKEPNKLVTWISFWLMTIGTVMAAWAMLAGKASVLSDYGMPSAANGNLLGLDPLLAAPTGGLLRYRFIDCWFLAAFFQLDATVPRVEKGKSG